MLCRTSNRSMLARSRSEKCAFVLAQSSKLSFFVRSCSLDVRIRVKYSEILAEHINVFRILLHKSTTYLMFVPLDVRISNARWCSCSKILENLHSYSLDTRKICVRHNTKQKLNWKVSVLFKNELLIQTSVFNLANILFCWNSCSDILIHTKLIYLRGHSLKMIFRLVFKNFRDSFSGSYKIYIN